MAVPQGYTPLAKVGTLDRGTYSASTTYNKLDFVYYNGSSWIAQKDGMRGITPAEGDNWHYFAKGFTESDATDINISDTSNLMGSGAGRKTTLQRWGDKVADWLVSKAITNDNFVAKLSERLVNNGTTTTTGFALDARYGKTLNDAVSALNSGFRKDENTDYAVMGKSTDGNSYISFYDKSNILYQLLYNNDKIWFASNEGGNYNVKWELNPNWTKGTVTFSNGFTNTNGVLWLNNSIKMALVKLQCNIATINKAGWITIATISCHAKENTIDRIVLNDVNRDFQINGESISCYCEKGDSNKRLIITKMFLIN